eukprot:Gb_16525 [translate_table: standard]
MEFQVSNQFQAGSGQESPQENRRYCAGWDASVPMQTEKSRVPRGVDSLNRMSFPLLSQESREGRSVIPETDSEKATTTLEGKSLMECLRRNQQDQGLGEEDRRRLLASTRKFILFQDDKEMMQGVEEEINNSPRHSGGIRIDHLPRAIADSDNTIEFACEDIEEICIDLQSKILIGKFNESHPQDRAEWQTVTRKQKSKTPRSQHPLSIAQAKEAMHKIAQTLEDFRARKKQRRGPLAKINPNKGGLPSQNDMQSEVRGNVSRQSTMLQENRFAILQEGSVITEVPHEKGRRTLLPSTIGQGAFRIEMMSRLFSLQQKEQSSAFGWTATGPVAYAKSAKAGQHPIQVQCFILGQPCFSLELKSLVGSDEDSSLSWRTEFSVGASGKGVSPSPPSRLQATKIMLHKILPLPNGLATTPKEGMEEKIFVAEIEKAMSNMELGKAIGPNGFLVEFYQILAEDKIVPLLKETQPKAAYSFYATFLRPFWK